MILSIIIPAYNAEKYIDRCLKSVYYEVLDHEIFEVITINDGSKDRTAELLEGYCDKYSNLKFIDKENEGVSVARNIGIDMAKGDYVMFLDVDDELTEGALKKVCEYLKSHEPIDMLVTRQLRNNGKYELIDDAPQLEEYNKYNGVDAYRKGFIRTNAGGGICRRDFLNEYKLRFPAGVKNAEDTVFFCQLQVYAKSIVYYNLPLYRIHVIEGSASMSDDFTKLGKSHVVTMQAIEAVKKSLKCDRQQKAIFDFAVYQIMANTIANFVASKQLTYKDFRKGVNTKSLLPLDIQNMYIFRDKARLLNFSVLLFYLLSWIKHNM